MTHSHHHASCTGCCRGISRRDFVKGAGLAAAAAGTIGAAGNPARGSGDQRVRVGLVFLSKAGSSWPYPTFDVTAREKQILRLLKDGCPKIEFVPVAVRDPDDVRKAVALDNQVDGYLIYAVTLTWNLRPAMSTIGKLGKPMIVADEYLGGSGLFLVGYSAIRREGIPAVGVATTRPSDLVAVVRCFADVKKPGTTPESFAARCDQVYRKTFPKVGEMKCIDDPVSLNDIGDCVERFKKYRFLIVGRDGSGRERDYLGAKGIHIGFDELKTVYDKIDPEMAGEWAERWSREADKLVDVDPEWIRKAGAVYLATLALLERCGTDTVTMDCLGGFARGELPAYPCLGFMQLLNDGGHGVCEAMPDDTLSMLMARLLTGRPGFVSDPVLDTAKNQIVYAHCVATTKVFGPEGRSNMFRIRTLHDHDPRGTCAQSFMPEGYMTTSFRTNFSRKEMVIHQAKSAGNLDSDRGCRSQLIGEVRGDIGNLFHEWDSFSWHRVTVYGHVKAPLIEFGKALGLSIVEEA